MYIWKSLREILRHILVGVKKTGTSLLFVAAIMNLLFAAVVVSGYLNLERTVGLICGNAAAGCSTNMEVIEMAAQLGRLDLVTTLFALAGIVLIVLTVGGIAYTRSEAKETMEKWLVEEAKPRFNKMAADLILESIEETSIIDKGGESSDNADKYGKPTEKESGV